jgi:pimeloyl-ACP methyl ester carboxylesterase
MPYTTINASQIYYESAGEGPALILGHAGFVDSRMWDDQWPVLAERYRVIRYDMQGFGRSDRATGPISRRQEVLELTRQLDVADAIFVGSSLSGATFIDLALAQPALVRALVTLNAVPTGFQMQGDPPRYLMAMYEAWQQGDLDPVSELQLRIWIDGMYREPEDVDPALRQRVAEMNQIAVRNMTGPVADFVPVDPLDPPPAARLGEIHCPTLVGDSTLENPEVRRAAQVMVETIPGAQRATVEDAAHLPSLEQPAAFNRLLLDFLAGLA